MADGNPPAADSPGLVAGKVTKAHGLRGEVTVLVLSEVESRFEPGSVLHLEDGRALTVAATRPDRGRLLVTFEGVADRNAAEQLNGRYLFVPKDDAPDLPGGVVLAAPAGRVRRGRPTPGASWARSARSCSASRTTSG